MVAFITFKSGICPFFLSPLSLPFFPQYCNCAILTVSTQRRRWNVQTPETARWRGCWGSCCRGREPRPTAPCGCSRTTTSPSWPRSEVIWNLKETAAVRTINRNCFAGSETTAGGRSVFNDCGNVDRWTKKWHHPSVVWNNNNGKVLSHSCHSGQILVEFTFKIYEHEIAINPWAPNVRSSPKTCPFSRALGVRSVTSDLPLSQS